MMAPPKAARAMSVSEIKIFFLRAAPVRRFAPVTADAAGGGAGTAGEENAGEEAGEGGAVAWEGDAAGGGATGTTASEKFSVEETARAEAPWTVPLSRRRICHPPRTRGRIGGPFGTYAHCCLESLPASFRSSKEPNATPRPLAVVRGQPGRT